MKKLWLLMSFAAVLVLGACGGGSDEPEEAAEDVSEDATTEEATDDAAEDAATGEAADAGDTQLAEESYQQNNCMGCHGENLEGGSGPALADVGSRLSEDEIRTTIEEGGNGMPGGLVQDEAELDALVQWLSSQTE